MLLIWILLNFCVVKRESALIRKENSQIDNGGPMNDTEDTNILDNNEGLQDNSIDSVEEVDKDLENSHLNMMYQQSAWEQVVATVDSWEDTGVLSSKLRAVSPSEVINEDASEILDYILSTVKPFLNNSEAVADAGTALNMHNCSVNGIIEGLQRDGPATLSVHNNTATLIFTITTKTLKMNCDWYQWVMVKYYGVVSATLSSITVETVVDLILEPDEHPIVRKTTVKELGDISSDITGVGPLGVLVKTIINGIVQQYREMIIDSLEQQAPIAIQASLNNITLPNTENLTTVFNDEIKSEQSVNLNEDENDNSTITEELVDNLDVSDGNEDDNEIELKVGNISSDDKKNNDGITAEKFEDDLDESNGTDGDNEIKEQIENTSDEAEKEDKKKDYSNVTENYFEDLEEYDSNGGNNEMETQVERTNNERIKEENDLHLLNDYGNNIHPKLIQVASTTKKSINYRNQEKLDLTLLNDHENNINPKFKKIDKNVMNRDP